MELRNIFFFETTVVNGPYPAKKNHLSRRGDKAFSL